MLIHNTSMASSSYSSQLRKNYDVFLSFRGEDTRKTFADYLYSTLEDRLISTYKDDVALPRGESIRPSLFKAIEGSRIAVIIFSEKYADSSWCLDELAHIMKCREERNLIVMPVFYCVDPSEVRKQKGKFEEAFAKHKIENNNKVESWRDALVRATEIAGWEPKNIANGYKKCYTTLQRPLWRAEMEKIPTKLALRNRNVFNGDPSCPLCSSADESAEHIFTSCYVSSVVWNDISSWCRIPFIYAFSIIDLLGIHKSIPVSAKKKEAVYGIVIVACWSLWRARNNLVFSNSPVRIDRILSEIKVLSFLWFSNRSKFKGVSWEEWISFVNM
ncbi:putative TIR domain, reverse transcriptase zinc-binding domain-containing protein [Helianthus annuus]|uniref:Putative toll/interleukin-1 receptor (TIR) domain-containing protein n=1 Tax=Helianthus annuus TaxID=4232 RepID=A0A251VEJ6_HELAN|nr:putative TIR domain, reverse transcriptase zinc-binding domain-containing protein [Helianthus annuus]